MINRLPYWFRQELPDGHISANIHLLSEFGVNTVCQQAKCPNLNSCFSNHKLAFLILGDTCSRNCRFCAVKKSRSGPGLDADEPDRISALVKLLGLKFVVITSVTRDDLLDGGAAQFARTTEAIYNIDSNIKVEVLIPDFQGNLSALKCVVDASPSVIAHNIETVRRLYKEIRPQADYQLSLDILKMIKEINNCLITKSSIILGMGETEAEVIRALQDLKNAQVDILTLGQYLAPSKEHYPVQEFIHLTQFEKYKDFALELGFKAVLSGPLARSSYRAEEVYKELKECMI